MLTTGAHDRIISLIEAAQQLESALAFVADVFIQRHGFYLTPFYEYNQIVLNQARIVKEAKK